MIGMHQLMYNPKVAKCLCPEGPSTQEKFMRQQSSIPNAVSRPHALLAALAVIAIAGCESPPFTIVVFPDTQHYVPFDSDHQSLVDELDVYKEQSRWVVDNRVDENILFAIHVGDVIEENHSHLGGNPTDQFEEASEAHSILEDADPAVPYSVTTGNHDLYHVRVGTGGYITRDSSDFNAYFGPWRFENRPWYEGSREAGKNDSNYNLFEHGNLEFIVINLEFAPPKDALCWADEILSREEMQNKRAIIVTHCYMTNGLKLMNCATTQLEGSEGHVLWDEFIRKHENIFLVLCGHANGFARMYSENVFGQTVNQVLADFQSEPAGLYSGVEYGNGWLVPIKFVPEEDKVYVHTESVLPGDAYWYDWNGYIFPLGADGTRKPKLHANGDRSYRIREYDTVSFKYHMNTPVTPRHIPGGPRFHDRPANQDPAGNQMFPAVAVNGGRFIVAWQYRVQDSYFIGYRIFTQHGCPVTDDIFQYVGSMPSGSRQVRFKIDVAPFNDRYELTGFHGFVVTWGLRTFEDGDPVPSLLLGRVKYLLVDLNGGSSEPVRVAPFEGSAPNRQLNPSVASADNMFAIVYEDDSDFNGNHLVYTSLFDGYGRKKGGPYFEQPISHPDIGGIHVNPVAAIDSSLNMVVAWQGRGAQEEFNIKLRGIDCSSGESRFFVDLDGSQISYPGGHEIYPDLAMDGDGNFVVSWLDLQDKVIDMKHYTSSGTPGLGVYSQSRSVAQPGDYHQKHSIAMNEDGAIIVVWDKKEFGTYDDDDKQIDFEIYGKYYPNYSSTHEQLIQPQRMYDYNYYTYKNGAINYTSRGLQAQPDIAMDARGNAVVVWQDDMNENGQLQVLVKGVNYGSNFIDEDNDGINDVGDFPCTENLEPGCYDNCGAVDSNSDGRIDRTEANTDTQYNPINSNQDDFRQRRLLLRYNPSQEDQDGDGIGDACDETSLPAEHGVTKYCDAHGCTLILEDLCPGSMDHMCAVSIYVPPGALLEPTTLTIQGIGSPGFAHTGTCEGSIGGGTGLFMVLLGPETINTLIQEPIYVGMTWPDQDDDGLVDNVDDWLGTGWEFPESSLQVSRDGNCINSTCEQCLGEDCTQLDGELSARCRTDRNIYYFETEAFSEWVLFARDATPPVVTIDGVEDQAYYAGHVTPVVSIVDRSEVVASITLDGTSFESGQVVSSEGAHELVVAAADIHGNVAELVSVGFTIDTTAPEIIISGVIDGGRYYGSVTIEVDVDDANPDVMAALLDGQPYVPGTVVTTVGDHTLVVTATDMAGNSANTALAFDLRTGMPPMPYATCSLGQLTISNNGSIRSRDDLTRGLVACNENLDMRNNTRVHGDAVVGGDASLVNNASVTGDIYLGGTIVVTGNSAIGGEIIEPKVVPEPCGCGYDLAQTFDEAEQYNDNEVLLQDPSAAEHLVLGGLRVEHNDVLVLSSGDYYLSYLHLDNNSTLVIEPGALVRLFVSGEVSVQNNANIISGSGIPSELVTICAGENVSMVNNSDVDMSVYAPRANITFTNNSELRGGITGGSIDIANNGTIIISGDSNDAPPLNCNDSTARSR